MSKELAIHASPRGVYFLSENPHFWYFQDWDDVRRARDILTRMLDEHEAESPAPEADREEAEEPLVGEPPAGESGVQASAPLLESPEE